MKIAGPKQKKALSDVLADVYVYLRSRIPNVPYSSLQLGYTLRHLSRTAITLNSFVSKVS